MTNIRAIALTAVCSAMATVCFVGATYIELFGFILSLLGGVLVCVPMIVTPRYRGYTVLAIAVSFTLTAVFASSRIVELVYYCLTLVPLVVVKAWCDRVTLDIWQEEGEQNIKVGKPKLTKTKWVLYYVFMQISIAGIVLVTYLIVPLEWAEMSTSYLLYVMIILLEVMPIPFDKLLNGVFPIVKNAMIKAKLVP